MWKPLEAIGREKKHTKTVHFLFSLLKLEQPSFVYFFHHTIFLRDFCITFKCITQLAFPKQRYSSLFSWNSKRMAIFRWSGSHVVLFLAILGYFLQSRSITKCCPHIIWAPFQIQTTSRTSLTSLGFNHICHTTLNAFEGKMEGFRQWDCYRSQNISHGSILCWQKSPLASPGYHRGLCFF